ncbi:AAC(3) family N-acetyltransferase [Streptomyces drozdowiczii]|uniref:AAC(3) family N-acetyltransferase n=3 Tax=Streptomyces drozdowiczii TaxID=202862 RepID=A0ABY6PNL9_9ACTN|nr:AAC(3) family N-acetyltransferase [Streptomyces drozdowiczii]UZK53784.1 AAC(3) family N-acetyltransferase [Streptomyces drozdowiczii]
MTSDFELSLDELRAVARYATEAAEGVLPVFEAAHPGDARPRAAIETAREFIGGAPRTRLQRVTSMDAHRAAKDAATEAARLAAQAAGDAASAAYLHPIAKAHQVAHILRAAANAARIAEIEDPGAGDRALERARERATPTLIDVLRRYPPAPTGRSRTAQLMTVLDAALREEGSPPLTGHDLRAGFEALGLPVGATVIVHASLSSFGRVEGGVATVLGALREHLGPQGTVVVPAFTGDAVRDPHPGAGADADRSGVPLFHDRLPTLMGALPTAVLADPERLRSSHPQASVAALGPLAREITARQPLAYAVGRGSPFDRLHGLGAHILLLGVGHNRNSFLHYAESLIPNHRRKLRRFPYLVDGERVWVEAPDVGDDNGRHFPGVGAEAEDAGLVRTGVIGAAECRLMESRPFIEFAARRLRERLAAEGRETP